MTIYIFLTNFTKEKDENAWVTKMMMKKYNNEITDDDISECVNRKRQKTDYFLHQTKNKQNKKKRRKQNKERKKKKVPGDFILILRAKANCLIIYFHTLHTGPLRRSSGPVACST
jgi:hypothetical protein